MGMVKLYDHPSLSRKMKQHMQRIQTCLSFYNKGVLIYNDQLLHYGYFKKFKKIGRSGNFIQVIALTIFDFSPL